MSGEDSFRMMFYEEARELLIGLEEGLLELERRQGDRAHLDKTFRAAHSLKGAAAMVGLPAIAEFTHHMEAVLDRIRSNKLGVDSDLTSTLLEARDQLAAMVESEAVEAPIPAPVELVQRLIGLLSEAPRATPKPPAPPAPVVEVVRAKEEVKEKVEQREKAEPTTSEKPKARVRKPKAKPAKQATIETPDHATADTLATAHGGKSFYRITLKPGAETLRRGVNPLGVLDELRELGPTFVVTDPSLVPTLDELDPERCYLAWEVDVVTDAPRERIDDVFLFVAEDSAIDVSFHAGHSTAPAPPSKTAPAAATAPIVTVDAPKPEPAPAPPIAFVQPASPPPPTIPPRTTAGAASPCAAKLAAHSR